MDRTEARRQELFCNVYAFRRFECPAGFSTLKARRGAAGICDEPSTRKTRYESERKQLPTFAIEALAFDLGKILIHALIARRVGHLAGGLLPKFTNSE
jgi:hypothetical protein